MRDKILEYVKKQEAPLGGVVDIPGKNPSPILTAGLIPTLISLEEFDFAQRCALYLTATQKPSGYWVNHHGEIKEFDIAYIGRHLNMAYNSFGEDDYGDAAERGYEYLMLEYDGHKADPIGHAHHAVALGGEYLREWVVSHPTRLHDLLLAADLLKGRKQKRDKAFLIDLAKKHIRPDGLVTFTTDGNSSDIAATAMLGVLEPSLAPQLIRAIEPWVNADGSLPVIAGTPDKSTWVSKFVLDLYKAAE